VSIFDKIRRGERDTGQVFAFDRVTWFEKTQPFRDLRQKGILVASRGSKALLAYHKGSGFFCIPGIM
jgi:hypothetical protein